MKPSNLLTGFCISCTFVVFVHPSLLPGATKKCEFTEVCEEIEKLTLEVGETSIWKTNQCVRITWPPSPSLVSTLIQKAAQSEYVQPHPLIRSAVLSGDIKQVEPIQLPLQGRSVLFAYLATQKRNNYPITRVAEPLAGGRVH